MKIGFWNVQGTRGIPKNYKEFLYLYNQVNETVFFAFVELYKCKFKKPYNKNFHYYKYSNFLRLFGSKRYSKFYSSCTSKYSTVFPKWEKLPNRINIHQNEILSTSIGIGITSNLEPSSLFIDSPFGETSSTYRGFLSSLPKNGYSSLIYKGDRNSEIRQVVFFCGKFNQKELIICTTHFSTVLLERTKTTNIYDFHGKILRRNHCIEICEALDYLKEIRNTSASIIILGDFNCSPDSYELIPFKKIGLNCCFIDPYPSTKNSGICTDHIWHSSSLKMKKIELIQPGPSDHKALIIDFDF